MTKKAHALLETFSAAAALLIVAAVSDFYINDRIEEVKGCVVDPDISAYARRFQPASESNNLVARTRTGCSYGYKAQQP